MPPTRLFPRTADAGPRRPGDGTPNPFGMVSRTRGLLHDLPDPPSAPAWLGDSDLQAVAAAFGRSGFRGGLNYYRNLDRNWQLQASLDGMRVHVPALFAIPGMDRIIASMPGLVTDLRGSVTLDGAGHWIQQERADAVNELILIFANSLTRPNFF